MSNCSLSLEQQIQQLNDQLTIEPASALSNVQGCLITAKEQHSPDAVLQCLIIAARAALQLDDLKLSTKHIKAALKFQQTLDNDDNLAEILHIHALIYWHQAQYYSAQHFWIQSLEQSAWSDGASVQIESLIGLGNVWRETEEYGLAKIAHELAVRVANATRNENLEIQSRILLSWDLHLLESFAEMLTVLQGAEDLLKRTPNNAQEAQLWDFRAVALLGLKHVDEAEYAADNAYALADKQQHIWMKTLALMSKARIELLREEPQLALTFLKEAEGLAKACHANYASLLARIYYKQSLAHEKSEQMDLALNSFKLYRHHSIEHIRARTLQLGSDKARLSKHQLEKKARKLINRIHAQHAHESGRHFNRIISETLWWEQLVQLKTQLTKANYSVITIRHPNPDCIDACAEIAHTLCTHGDYLAQISSDRLGWLVDEQSASAEELYRILNQMMAIYPWQRKGIAPNLPTIKIQDLLTFPFTLEQLEQEDDQQGDR
ncbi:hypothetical protein [Vibrio tritonius]|uniref:hypothetical protein n=1 Tax=Vibrio tritonius TaxID=1435069 RepID=UPI00315DE621